MFVQIARVPFYLVTGFILFAYLSQTYAAPNVARSPQQFGNTLSKGPSSVKLPRKVSILKSYKKAITNIADQLKLYPAKLQQLKSIKQKEPRVVLETLLTGPSIDSATNLVIAVSNFINGRTNISAVDKYMNSFRSFMTSNGLNSTIIYTNIIMSFWTVYDAVGWIFRFNEERYYDRRDRINEKLNEDNEAVEEIIATLDIANSQLNAFKKSLLVLICQKIDKSAMEDGKILIKRSNLERQIDCSSLLRKRVDAGNGNQENEEEQEDEIEANEDDDEYIDGKTTENETEIPKEEVIPEQHNDSVYLNNYDNSVKINNDVQVNGPNYEENDISDSH